MQNRTFCNLECLFLFIFKGNIQCAKKVLRLVMEYADGDKCKIVYSSPEAMVEFSGEKKLKLSLSARQKPICKFILKGQGIFSLDVNKKPRFLKARFSTAYCGSCLFMYLLCLVFLDLPLHRHTQSTEL